MPLMITASRHALVGLAVILQTTCVASLDEPRRSPTIESSGSKSSVKPTCETAAEYSDRWSHIALGGPSIGPVTLALGKAVTTGNLPIVKMADDRWSLKLLILVDAPAGTPLRATARRQTDGLRGRLTHFSKDHDRWDLAAETLEGTVPDRGHGPGQPNDIPGALLVAKSGCYEVSIVLGEEQFGPFGILIGP